MPRIAFYAPLKPADHAVPSGDRAMARLFLKALRQAGFEVEGNSSFRSYNPGGDADFSSEARAEMERLFRLYRKRPPHLWFTYHVYYKAPDLLGPTIARMLRIPYVIAEGSRAPKRAKGAWATGHAQAEAALDAADLILIPNPRDRAMLEAARPSHQKLVDLPPFIDVGAWPLLEHEPARCSYRLLSVAMMRQGDKLASYEILAQALARLDTSTPWQLDIVGDGPARMAVETLFAPFGDRITFHGRIDDQADLARFYATADMLVWPAVNEAFGMVFLEAALQGCPSIAGNFGGVGTVVLDCRTGLLTRPGDAGDFAAAISRLIRDSSLRQELSAQAQIFARHERSLASTARHLQQALLPLVERARPGS